MIKKHTLTLKLSLLPLAVITALSQAQESNPPEEVASSPGVFEQILITAQKREQYLNCYLYTSPSPRDS